MLNTCRFSLAESNVELFIDFFPKKMSKFEFDNAQYDEDNIWKCLNKETVVISICSEYKGHIDCKKSNLRNNWAICPVVKIIFENSKYSPYLKKSKESILQKYDMRNRVVESIKIKFQTVNLQDNVILTNSLKTTLSSS